jgi:hypothetical protein
LKKKSLITTPMLVFHRSFHVMSRSVGTMTPGTLYQSIVTLYLT